MSKELSSVDEILEALGGANAVAELVGGRPGTVRMWRHQGLPSYSFLILQAALAEKGCSAPPSLWDVPEPEGWKLQFVKSAEAAELNQT